MHFHKALLCFTLNVCSMSTTPVTDKAKLSHCYFTYKKLHDLDLTFFPAYISYKFPTGKLCTNYTKILIFGGSSDFYIISHFRV